MISLKTRERTMLFALASIQSNLSLIAHFGGSRAFGYWLVANFGNFIEATVEFPSKIWQLLYTVRQKLYNSDALILPTDFEEYILKIDIRANGFPHCPIRKMGFTRFHHFMKIYLTLCFIGK